MEKTVIDTDERESTMYIEVAVIDSDGWRSTIHAFDEVVGFAHHRGEDPDNPVDRVAIDMVNGKEIVKGLGYGVEVAFGEIE